jgi:hypothetical protein
MTGLAAQAVAGTSQLRALLRDARIVGGVYHLDFERAVVLTNDVWKLQVHGIPNYSFLLATTIREDGPVDTDDEEVILLRVEGVANLPNQSDLVLTRLDAMREAMKQDKTAREVVDPLTQGEMQWSGLDCRVLGTFYDDVVGTTPMIAWGADMDNLYSAARYFVYRPGPEAMSFIASYPHLTAGDIEADAEPHRIRIGSVRYSSTRRRARLSGSLDVPVYVRVADFVSMKTAVFGMTRAGKSNTVKIIATAVFEFSRRENVPIGQLIFDPAGEYANPNQQDQTALSLLGEDWVTIYRFGARAGQPGVRPLQINFYDEDQRPAARQVLATALASNNSQYITRFLAAEIDEPDEELFPVQGDLIRARNHASRGRLAFYALLAKAGLRVPRHWQGVVVSMAQDLAQRILADHPGCLIVQRGSVRIQTSQGLREVMDWLVENAGDAEVDRWSEGEPFRAIKPVYDLSGGTAGYSQLRGIADFHNPDAAGDHCAEILEELVRGHLVIVDLSLGSERVTQTLSERIVNHLLESANERFRNAQRPHRIQVYVEEAHRLFDREDFNKKSADPWVRLAKEAAKFEIGLVYATQEVSSVEPRVLANTHNWVVAHLNSGREIRELANYYDFASFANATLRAEDRGYVRLKTLSGKYIVPVQVDRFAHGAINSARAAAGLPPVVLGLDGATLEGNGIAAVTATSVAEPLPFFDEEPD